MSENTVQYTGPTTNNEVHTGNSHYDHRNDDSEIYYGQHDTQHFLDDPEHKSSGFERPKHHNEIGESEEEIAENLHEEHARHHRDQAHDHSDTQAC